jgi:hypothetical protein
MKEITCEICNACADVSHLLLFCQQYQEKRNDLTSSLQSSLLSVLKYPHLPFRGRTVSIKDCDFVQLLLILISLPPAFLTVNQHPLTQQQVHDISSCFSTSSSSSSFHQYQACLSCFELSANPSPQQQYKPMLHSESAFIYPFQFPSNVLTRWAFGGFGYDEFSQRLKDRVHNPKELRRLYSFFRNSLFQYAFDLCSSFLQ